MQAGGPITSVKTEGGIPPGPSSTLAARVKWARVERKLSQPALAKAAGVSQGTIGNIESGERKRPRDLLAIAKALYANPEWLESGKGEWDMAKAQGGPASREKGAHLRATTTEEDQMLDIWRKMSPSDRKAMLLEMAEKAERYQRDMQQSLDEAGVKLPFPLTSPVSAAAVRKATSRTSVPARQRELDLKK